MSGGVDSSVAAYLLLQQGYEVTGVFIEAYNEPGCQTDQDKKDALQVALKLGIPFQVLDLRKEYAEKVVKYFYETYALGETPNPDIVCNREVKFGLFYDWAIRQFDYMATGHYARITELDGGRLIQRAADTTKDQSYFLWQVDPGRLARIVLPLGEMKKTEVRKIADKIKLPNAHKPDSMGVCMMGNLSVRDFLKKQLGEQPGGIWMDGIQVGSHRGIWFHTVGQRGGFEINKSKLKELGYKPETMKPLYVTGKDKDNNRIIVGTQEQAKRGGFGIRQAASRVGTARLQDMLHERKLFVRIRNLGELLPIKELNIQQDREWQIKLAEPAFGVAEGQAAVIYAQVMAKKLKKGDECVVAGGEISIPLQH